MIKTFTSFVVKYHVLLILGIVFLIGCKDHQKVQHPNTDSNAHEIRPNILSEISGGDLNGLNWLNKPEEYKIQNNSVIITAPENSDFFIDPEDHKSTATAPVLYREVAGDFIAVTKVTPDLTSQWNAAALLVFLDDFNWIKFGFENSDATGPGIVSVITRETSDDANGAILNDAASLWLKLVRKGNNYSMHWSLNGKEYKMARLAAMPSVDTVKLGIEAQCPAGSQAIHRFDYFSIESTTVKALRAGE